MMGIYVWEASHRNCFVKTTKGITMLNYNKIWITIPPFVGLHLFPHYSILFYNVYFILLCASWCLPSVLILNCEICVFLLKLYAEMLDTGWADSSCYEPEESVNAKSFKRVSTVIVLRVVFVTWHLFSYYQQQIFIRVPYKHNHTECWQWSLLFLVYKTRHKTIQIINCIVI